MLCSFIGSAWVVVTCIVHPSHFYVRYLGINLSLSKKISCLCSKESSLFTSEDKVETGACLFVFYLFLTLVSYYGIYLFICAAASNLPTVLFRKASHTTQPCRDALSMVFFCLFVWPNYHCSPQAQWFSSNGRRACGAGPTSSKSFRKACQKL